MKDELRTSQNDSQESDMIQPAARDNDSIAELLRQALVAARYAVQSIEKADRLRKTEGDLEIGVPVTNAISNGYAACGFLRTINEQIERRQYLENLGDEDE